MEGREIAGKGMIQGVSGYPKACESAMRGGCP